MENLLFPLLLVALLVPMFLAMRRQKKEMQSTAQMQTLLQVGDRVMMSSGIQGIVVELDDETVDLEIAVDVITTWSRAAVKEVVKEDVDVQDEVVADDATPAVEESASDTERRLNKD
ncbi:preprotein translocase subunit YajC [Antrihabitans sp. YC2-6]|uniref:preprotein translocase subunit YajC n=1 Tax=Antrihabitans sp. YC2-6 TaxID=2799498 RepID=UPI0018F42851|nr:preprotein translocase subunit YajC [Antrihabitans sp. YC2-6]MBJ8345260.1 preprotein translocase subunit YajC [Antrihabitans sp. YC2-6]